MSCEFCDQIQEDNLKGKNLAYFRVDTGNVLIGACDKHFNILTNRNENLTVVRMTIPKVKD